MKNDRDLLIISILTFITVSAWICFELLKTTKTSTVDQSTEQLITPLDPKIDIETLELLEARNP